MTSLLSVCLVMNNQMTRVKMPMIHIKNSNLMRLMFIRNNSIKNKMNEVLINIVEYICIYKNIVFK